MNAIPYWFTLVTLPFRYFWASLNFGPYGQTFISLAGPQLLATRKPKVNDKKK